MTRRSSCILVTTLCCLRRVGLRRVRVGAVGRIT